MQTYLKLLGANGGREEATQIVCISLFLSESKPFVVLWIPQQRAPTAHTKTTPHTTTSKSIIWDNTNRSKTVTNKKIIQKIIK